MNVLRDAFICTHLLSRPSNDGRLRRRADQRSRRGWRLEQFICEEVLACGEGDQFESISDARIEQFFNRRSGALAAAIAISVEAPAPPAAAA